MILLKRLLLTLALLAAPSLVAGQGSNSFNVIKVFPGVPTGACQSGQLAVNSLNGDIYSCSGGAWILKGGGAGTTVDLQTNGISNATQTILNHINSTVNGVGLAATFSNPSGGNEKLEITGGSYTGNAATSTNFDHTPTTCTASQVAQGVTAHGDATGCTPAGIGFGANIVVPSVLAGGSLQMGNCTFTNGSPNVSCPNALWDSSMVGYLIRANSQNNGNAFVTTATVQSVTDATHIVITNNATYTNAGGGSVGLYPRDETSTINSAIATALSITNCGSVAIPRGIYLITSTFAALNAGIPAGCTQWGNGASPGLQILGYPGSIQGKATNLVMPPDFDFSTCTISSNTVCFGGGTGLLRLSDFNIVGQQWTALPAAAANRTVVSASAQNFGVHHLGDTTTQAGFQSFLLPGNGSKCLRCVFDATGPVNWGGNFGSFSGYMEGGVYVILGASANFQMNSDGTEVDGISFTAAGAKAFCSQGSRLVAGSISGASTTIRSSTTNVDLYLDGCVMVGSSTNNAFLATGGNGLRVHMTHTNMSGSYTNLANGPVDIYDDCGNTFTGGLGSWTGAWFGSCSTTGTTQTAGNWSTPAGAGAGQWGTSPSTGTCSGNSLVEQCTITVGSGTVGTSPVLTVTFPTAFKVAPTCTANMVGGTATWSNFTNGTINTTSGVFTYNGTPGASTTIVLRINCSN